MRTYRDAWMENSSDIDARLEWDTEDKIQHAIDCLKMSYVRQNRF